MCSLLLPATFYWLRCCLSLPNIALQYNFTEKALCTYRRTLVYLLETFCTRVLLLPYTR